jgi:preprotein translocase subunit SecG
VAVAVAVLVVLVVVVVAVVAVVIVVLWRGARAAEAIHRGFAGNFTEVGPT